MLFLKWIAKPRKLNLRINAPKVMIRKTKNKRYIYEHITFVYDFG